MRIITLKDGTQMVQKYAFELYIINPIIYVFNYFKSQIKQDNKKKEFEIMKANCIQMLDNDLFELSIEHDLRNMLSDHIDYYSRCKLISKYNKPDVDDPSIKYFVQCGIYMANESKP